MTSLYNCKHSGDQYRVTKFTSDFEVEASYICDLHSCECPAGHRPTCRHRQMLPKFIARDYVGSNFFFDFDRGGWVQGWKEESTLTAEDLTRGLEDIVPVTPILASAALPIQPEPEPSPSQPHSQMVTTTDFDSVGDGSSPSVVTKSTIRRRV